MRDSALGSVRGTPARLLRLEGLALLVAAGLAYGRTDGPWWLFGLLFFAPDLGMLGYLANARIGALVYNAAHTTIAPGLLASAGLLLDMPTAVSLAAIWAAHVGFDRLLGYGLKYATGFGDTHLGALRPGEAPSDARRRLCGA